MTGSLDKLSIRFSIKTQLELLPLWARIGSARGCYTEVKLEHRERLSEPPRRAEGATAGPPGRAAGWRRSGEEGYWESLMSEVEALPHTPRPQSCIGGIGVEGWLQQLERVQGLPPTHAKMPPLSDRTVSMPTLHGGALVRQYPHQARGRDCAPRKPISRHKAPLGSEEDLFTPPGRWERARFRSFPQVEPVRVSALASVKNGWLPVQKRAVVCDITCQTPSLKDSTCQDQYKLSITTSSPKCYTRKNGFDYTEGEARNKSSTQANCMDPRTRRVSGQASPNITQASNLALPEGESPVGRERWKKGWVERRAAFFTDGIHSGDHTAMPRRHSPLQRTAGISVCSRSTAPPVGMEILPTKRGFSSITGTAHRAPRSHVTPSSSGTAAKSEENSKIESPPVNRPGEPIVWRRRASAIKATDIGRSETGPGKGPREFRHSYTEGDGKDDAFSRFCQRSGGTHPAQTSTCTPGSANAAPHPCRPRSCSLADAEVSGEKLYRSSLSLYLCRPSSGDPGRPPRPLSFAGAFRHADPGLGGAPLPAVKQPSRATPEKAKTGGGRDAACGVNTRPLSACLPGAGVNAESSQQDVGTRQRLGLHPGQRWSLESAAVKPQESGSHQSAEAILALNAASIIANIKLQTRINKMASLRSQQESKKVPEPGNEMVEDSGSHESSPPDAGVVRRAPGNAGRKARPRPIHWQEPLSHQQEDSAAPLTLREALQLLRPGFIRRSQRRVREVEQRALKRRAWQGTRRACRTEPNPPSDTHSKLADRAIAGKEKLLRSKSSAADMNRQDEKKKVVSQANRLRAAAFKKKLLDQILRRNLD
ncbi:hypothetical protein COCON_G00036010 [Conger conger]|uniref:ALMS motif domain-containing protein n=1 Tax=Conger conger TaxID=82655 RepID=A0A9Q1DZS9_CONCO|nr:hypothetical protein COCON_G00036010 [Conger conger]